MIESPTATTSASSTPKKTTQPVVTAAIATSTRSIAARARQAAGSTMLIAAATMTAPRTACGRYCTGPVRKRRITTIAPAENRPAIWVRAPTASFTAVRAPLAPTENACVKPAAAFAAPIVRSSCDARTCSPRLPANARAVRISSANETRKRPTAAGTSSRTSSSGGVGNVGRGRPPATGPTIATPWRAKSNSQERAIAADDDDQRSRHERQEAAKAEQRAERGDADCDGGAAHVAELARDLPEPVAAARVASTSSPSSLPSCAITSVTATPCR